MWIASRTFPAVALISALLPSIALYGLLLFYGLTKDELVGRKPLAKFLSIKLIVMFTFYQSFVVRSPEVSASRTRLPTVSKSTSTPVQCFGGKSDHEVGVLDGDEHRGRLERTRDLYRGAPLLLLT